ncbi:MAG: hypothetical protein DRP96_04805, partial [Candidatus Neomarinimicrobiota bacterium]
MRKQLTRYKNTISTKTLVLVFILLFLILSVSAVFDYFSRRKTVIDNMTHISQTLANTIRNSTASSIILNNLLNYYIENWFKSNLTLLNEIEESKSIDNSYL